MDSKINNLYAGILLGIFLPILSSYLFYAFLYSGDASYFELVLGMNRIGLFGKLLSVSIMPNMLVFFVATQFEKITLAKGMLYPTGVFIILAAIFRFLL